MLLLCLPDELIVLILTHAVLAVDYCRAARACKRLLAAAEAASKGRLMLETSRWLYVPLEQSYGDDTRFTWRTRLALGFREAYNAASKLSWLGAGLIIYG